MVVAVIWMVVAGRADADVRPFDRFASDEVSTGPRDCSDLNVAGRWSGTGLDEGGARWDWTMELTQTGCSVQGVITWQATSGSSGREHIRGQLDPTSRRFDFNGQQMEQGRGAIILGIYHAQFSADLRRITGRWTNGVPGTFQGTKQ
jgi:hypothetical protein